VASTGMISGTPTAAGTASFTVQVTDSANNTGTKALSITVAAAAQPPTVTTTSLPGGTAGTAYSTALQGSGGTTPYTWSVSAGTLPAGLSLVASTGVISGTPTTAGTVSFTVKVTDAANNTGTKALSIAVAAAPQPPTVTTSSLPGGTTGTAYSTTLQASGGTTPYTWTVSAGTLPAGLSLVASTGVISGTPTTAGTVSFTVKVTDAANNTATMPLSIAITAAVTPVQITTTSVPAGQVGVAYSTMVQATGGTTPYSWSITSGALPAGVTLAAGTGSISGTPTASGSFNFTVKVTDSSSQTGTKAFTLTIAAAPNPVQITTSSLPSAQVNTSYSTTLAASNGTTPYSWSITSGSLPTGLTLSAATGAISGTPTTAGTSNFTVKVTDSGSPATSASANLSITVAPAASSHSVLLNWTASPSPGVTGYNVYRSTTSGIGYVKINSSAIAGLSYTDSTVSNSTTYYYVTTSVDNSGDESTYSMEVQMIIP
jgi:hypothetical protein